MPIVLSAVLFDLVGDYRVRPDFNMGYKGLLNARRECPNGNVGAGMGATVGKF